MVAVIDSIDFEDILPKRPLDPMKGLGYRREILRMTGQGLPMDVVRHFFDSVPDNHRERMTIQKVDRRLLSPEAWILWLAFKRSKGEGNVDYAGMYAFEQL